jgi:CBS domain containing-hemolysin-like protein
MVLLVLFAILSVAGSFFCSLAEASLLASSEARIRAQVEAGRRGASTLLALKTNPGRTLMAIVVLSNVFQIVGSSIVAARAATVFEGRAGLFFVVAAAMTLLIILFGEMTPKILADANPEPIASTLAPTLVWVRRVLTPLTVLVERLLAWARPRSRVLPGDEREIRELARIGEDAGHLSAHEAEIIHRVFRLDDITAADVMTPRGLVRGFRAGETLEAAKERLLASNHAQFPVYEEDLDKVVGLLVLRDALAALARGERTKTVREVMKPAWFLPTSRTVDDVLRDFQARHGRMAIVIDEYGVTQGIITMDDLVEELVGEAIDETDVQEGLVKRLSRTAALVHGLTRVYDVSRFLVCHVEFQSPEDETATVTGALQDRLGRIPQVGDVVLVGPDLQLEVREADGRRAVRVLARNVGLPEPAPRAS